MANEKQSYLVEKESFPACCWSFRRALVTCALFTAPSSFKVFFLMQISIQKGLYRAYFSATIGHALRSLTWIGKQEHLQRCSVCNPAKLFFTSKFSYILFCNPIHEIETGTANRWGLLIVANHLDQSL